MRRAFDALANPVRWMPENVTLPAKLPCLQLRKRVFFFLLRAGWRLSEMIWDRGGAAVHRGKVDELLQVWPSDGHDGERGSDVNHGRRSSSSSRCPSRRERDRQRRFEGVGSSCPRRRCTCLPPTASLGSRRQRSSGCCWASLRRFVGGGPRLQLQHQGLLVPCGTDEHVSTRADRS